MPYHSNWKIIIQFPSEEHIMFNKLYPVIFILLLCTPLFSVNKSESNQHWRQIQSIPFFIFFQGENTNNAEKVLKTLSDSHLRLANEIGVTLSDTTSVYICPDEKTFTQFVGDNFPDWSVGVAAPSKNLIVIKSPNLLPNHADNSLIAVHELSHILLYKAVNQNHVPRWFNEGLAVYYSGEKAFASSSLISKALITKSIIDLKDIDKVLSFLNNKAQLAYQESYLAILYLFEQFGKDQVKQIIFLMGEGKSLDQAFKETIGMDVFDFEYEWFQHIQKKYRWHFLIDFDSYLWVLILLLFLIGFVLIRRRNKRTIQKWENDDSDWHDEWTVTQSPWDANETD